MPIFITITIFTKELSVTIFSTFFFLCCGLRRQYTCSSLHRQPLPHQKHNNHPKQSKEPLLHTVAVCIAAFFLYPAKKPPIWFRIQATHGRKSRRVHRFILSFFHEVAQLKSQCHTITKCYRKHYRPIAQP